MFAAALFLFPATGPAQAPPPTGEDGAPVSITADRMESLDDGRHLIAVGAVRIARGEETVEADFARIDTETLEVHARGGVLIRRADGTVWKGDRLNYSLRDGALRAGRFHLQSGPFHVFAESAETPEPDRILILRPAVTPCREENRREFQIRGRRAGIRDRRYVTLHHAVLWIGPVPLLYSPWWWKDLQSDGRLDFLPGFSSRLGAFLITSYHTPLNPRGTVRTASHLHLYSKRGAGFGQDLSWKDPAASAAGSAQAFYLSDARPARDERERRERAAYLEGRDRYRLRVRHSGDLGGTDRLWIDTSYLSDPWVVKDFYRREYREFSRPDNRLALTRRVAGGVASLTLQPRWNDFYETVTRLPEARFDRAPAELGDTGLYYEGRTGAARLERLFASDDPREAYSSWRLDTRHEIQMPRRLFGFLNLAPRAAYRATYYSDTLSGERTRTVFVPGDGEDGLVERQESFREEEGGKLRHVFELGGESSFKAFKVLDEGPSFWGDGLRHVAEPYLRHTYVPEPGIPPGELYFFDSADRLRKRHDLRFGLRNKLQTRSGRAPAPRPDSGGERPEPPGARVADLLDADLFTTLDLDPDPDRRALGPIGFDLRLRPVPGWNLDLDGQYDGENSRLDTFNTRLRFRTRAGHAAGLEHRYRADGRSQAAVDASLFPQGRWSLRTYHRFDLEQGELQEQSLLVSRRLECIRIGLGFRHEPGLQPGEEDTYRVWVDFQLLTLPGSGLQIGG